MKREICNFKCKHGIQARKNYIAWQKHEMTTRVFKDKALALFQLHCHGCMHNELGGKVARVFRKAFPKTFQQFDNSEVENDTTNKNIEKEIVGFKPP
jgi:hypothetical protein